MCLKTMMQCMSGAPGCCRDYGRAGRGCRPRLGPLSLQQLLNASCEIMCWKSFNSGKLNAKSFMVKFNLHNLQSSTVYDDSKQNACIPCRAMVNDNHYNISTLSTRWGLVKKKNTYPILITSLDVPCILCLGTSKMSEILWDSLELLSSIAEWLSFALMFLGRKGSNFEIRENWHGDSL